MTKHYIFCCFVIIAMLTSCTVRQEHKTSADTISTLYAKGFTMTPHDGYTAVEIKDPWNSGKILQRYAFVPRSNEIPADIPAGTSIIRTPVKKALVYSSVHAEVIKELGDLSSVKGVCDPQYFTIPEIAEGVKSGEIANVGSSMSPITEKIIELQPEVIILSPYQNSTYGDIAALGFPIIECADYMEANPLGRAEWIKLFGLLYEKVDLADSIYSNVVNSYSELKAMTANIEEKPKILSENIINGTWYVPGGDSYMAQLFADAGGRYAWADVHTSGSIPLDMPRVLEKAHDADVWLIKSFDPTFSYAKLKSQNSLNAHFKAFKEHNIYFCDTERTTFFQDFPFHPEVLLKEYIAIFHPQLIDGYTLKYFHPLKHEQ